jgi:hypothetical protein
VAGITTEPTDNLNIIKKNKVKETPLRIMVRMNEKSEYRTISALLKSKKESLMLV